MSAKAEFEGPLNNPEWTEEQNRRYDVDENFRTPEQAREAAIGPPARPSYEEKLVARRAVEEAKKIVQKTSRPKPRRPGFGRAADTADSDKRVKDQYDLYK